MADRWFYKHEGQTHGPTTAAALRGLAAAGQLYPADLIWAEGDDPARAIPAQAAIRFPEQGPPAASGAATPPTTPVREGAPGGGDNVPDREAVELVFDAEPADDETTQLGPPASAPTPAPALKTATPVPMASSPCRLAIGSASSRGLVRERNEDGLLIQHLTWINQDQRHEVALVVVADGMGGHQSGERASGLVIRTLGGLLAPLLSGALNGQYPDVAAAAVADTLGRAFAEANQLVYRTAKEDPACRGMGATAAAVLIWDGQAFLSHAGDCRVYHHRAGRLTQLTRDQTLVARMVELGQLTAAEAARHPARHEVTQAVGKHTRIEPDRRDLTLSRGDWLVVACDGLHAHVDDRTLQEAIGRGAPSAAHLAYQLVGLANQRGGSDNCTVAAVYCY
jgi:protein phosphatase